MTGKKGSSRRERKGQISISIETLLDRKERDQKKESTDGRREERPPEKELREQSSWAQFEEEEPALFMV